MTADEVRALVLSLPEVEQKSHFGTPDFRVRNKIIGTLREAEGVAAVKVTRWEMEALAASDPAVFKGSPSGVQSWLLVRYATVDPEHLRELFLEAWKMVTPAKMHALLLGTQK